MALLAHTLALLAMTVATAAINVVPLDMAQNSFDDQYLNCGPAMTEALPALNHSEFQENFTEAWAKATAEWQKWRSDSSPLSPAQAIGLMAYTTDHVYSAFNKAVRTAGRSRQEYRDNFHFKTLHFLLTQAVQRLQRPNECQTVFRGVRGYQFEVQTGDKVRFGQFASSSLDKLVAQDYGTDTMFKAHTCHGVNIQKFSFREREKEVLIPPFETFVVTDVNINGSTLNIELRSTGNFSNYNCEWLRGGSLPRNSSPCPRGLLLVTVVMAVAIGTL